MGARGFQRPISQAWSESVVTGMQASRSTRDASYWLQPWARRQSLSCWMSGSSSFVGAMARRPSWQRGARVAKAESTARLRVPFGSRIKGRTEVGSGFFEPDPRFAYQTSYGHSGPKGRFAFWPERLC
jgi:hypothetical protein